MGSRHSKPRRGDGGDNEESATLLRSMKRAGKRAVEVRHRPRSVVLITWGRNGQSSWSFHKCILIADEVIAQVSEDTAGTHWDWGSIIGGDKVTVNPPVQNREFTKKIFQKGVQYGNTYNIVGTTDWSDDKIKKLCKLFKL